VLATGYGVSTLNVYPTPLIDALEADAFGWAPLARVTEAARELERDCLMLAVRLYAEPAETCSPETLAVMDKWRPRVEALIRGETK